MITHDDVRRAVHIIDTSGIVNTIEDGIQRSVRGRKASVKHLRLLLIGMFLAVRHEGTASVQDIHTLLTEDLPLDLQADLGVRDRVKGEIRVLTIKNLYYQSERLMNGLAYGEGGADTVDDAERQRRHQVMTLVSNALMDVFDLGWTSTVHALDATGIWSWAKGGRKRKLPVDLDPDDDLTDEEIAALKAAAETGKIPGAVSRAAIDATDDKPSAAGAELIELKLGLGASFDRDAAWGIKTSKSGKREVFFGYHEHTLVQVPDKDQQADDEPRLIRRLELTPASVDVVDVSLRLLDSLPTPATDLIVDLHYSYKRFDRWKSRLIERRIRQHHDLRTDEQGFTEFERMRFAAGWAHCPATPDSLAVIPSLPPHASLEQLNEYNADIDRRFPYALRRINQPDVSGATRYECPALAGKVGCPLRAGTVQAALETGVPIIENPPDAARDREPLPRCCTQQSVLVNPPAKVRKLAQPLYWGSRAWQRMHNKRTYVEGSYGNRKNPSTENMRRGLFRSTGLVWANLVISMAAASHNERMLRKWHDRTGKGDPNHPLLQPDRDNHGFLFLTADQAAAFHDTRWGGEASPAAA